MTSTPVSTMASPGKKILALLLLAVFSAISLSGQVLHEGDLLFCCTDEPNAITDVTQGANGMSIDHVAIVHRIGGDEGPLFVIEAKKPAVCLTPIDAFCRENPHVLVGRVEVDVDFRKSIRRCLMQVGKPYDDLYLPGDSAIYCSELVQLNYVDSRGSLIFEPVPMSFHDATGQVTDYWLEFYAERGLTVPEGAPGTNPGELSRRPQVSIVALSIKP